MQNAVIVSAVRTAVGKAHRGQPAHHAPGRHGRGRGAGRRGKRAGIPPEEVEDVTLGCALPEAEQGMNIGRIAALAAGLPVTVAGQTLNRFCAGGLQAIAVAAQQIMSGMGEVLIAGGVESMSRLPMAGNAFAANPALAEHNPDVYLPMGLTAENVAIRYGIGRAEQDAFALRSHQRAAAAQDAGKFDAEILPLTVAATTGLGNHACGDELRLRAATKASAATPPPRRWRAYAPPSARTAASPRATAARRATAQRPCSS